MRTGDQMPAAPTPFFPEARGTDAPKSGQGKQTAAAKRQLGDVQGIASVLW